MPDYEDLILQRQEMYEIWEDEPEIDPKWYGSSCAQVPLFLLKEDFDVDILEEWLP